MDSPSFVYMPLFQGALPFVNGGLAGMFATACIQPTDMVKVCMQLQSKQNTTGVAPSPLAVARDVISRGRFLDLYTGLSAAMLRQAVYSTARIGLFETFQSRFERRAEERGRGVRFSERGAAALMAGGLAAMVGNPADLALVRMQADSFEARGQGRWGSKSGGVLATLRGIVGNEGVPALWSGVKPTVVRAMAMNFGQLAFFAESKAQIRRRVPEAPELAQLLGASAIAAFFGAVLCLPFDFIKTRLQQQVGGPDGRLPYRGMIHCARRVVREEGWLRFYRGFGTFCLRVAPQAMITLVVADQLNVLTSS